MACCFKWIHKATAASAVICALPNGQLLLAAPLSVAAGSLRSPTAFFMIAPQQNCGRYADADDFSQSSVRDRCRIRTAAPAACARDTILV